MDRGGHLISCLPVLGICGSSGSGKTTLLEALVPRFLGRGINVVVVKHGAHRMMVDHPGKDSDRFFRAGSDVLVFGEECFSRSHATDDFQGKLRALCRRYDLVLVEGHASTRVEKIWLLGREFMEPPPGTRDIVHVLRPEERQPDTVFSWIMRWFSQRRGSVPLNGCVLIGGKSRRMGQPKHLIVERGRTWLEQTVEKIIPHVRQVVLAGGGRIPDVLDHLVRLPDVSDAQGPMAGLLAAMRWQPWSDWLVVACDLPAIEPQVFPWLIDQASPGTRAVLPDLEGAGRVEPLLAWYGYHCLEGLEGLAANGCLRPQRLVNMSGVITPRPPAKLRACWRNVNTPEELRRHSAMNLNP